MKQGSSHTIIIFVLISTVVWAETSFERELAQLKDQHEKAIAAAVEPINRRHQSSLEQLLRRATQANDLAAANKIKAEIDGSADVAVSSGETVTSPNAVRKALVGAWNWESKKVKSWGTFMPDGHFNMDTSSYLVKIGSKGTVTFMRQDQKKATVRLNLDLKSFTGTDFDGQPLNGSLRE